METNLLYQLVVQSRCVLTNCFAIRRETSPATQNKSRGSTIYRYGQKSLDADFTSGYFGTVIILLAGSFEVT